MKNPVVRDHEAFDAIKQHAGYPSSEVDDREAQVLVHMLYDLSGPIVPDAVQRGAILAHVLQNGDIDSSNKSNLFISHVPAWITECPWRFAFGLSTAQAMICLLIFGSDYPHWIQHFFMR